MTKAEVISEVSKRTGVAKTDVQHIIHKFLSVVQDAVGEDKRVHFSGFGCFFKKKRAKKIGRNISTNTALIIEEHYIPYFKPAKCFVTKIKNSHASEV